MEGWETKAQHEAVRGGLLESGVAWTVICFWQYLFEPLVLFFFSSFSFSSFSFSSVFFCLLLLFFFSYFSGNCGFGVAEQRKPPPGIEPSKGKCSILRDITHIYIYI